MQLTRFDGQATGPQGTGAIPPEAMRQALRDTGTDLIGANMKPEEFPAVQQVMAREVDALLAPVGGEQASAVVPQAPAYVPDTPPVQAAPGVPGAPQTTTPDAIQSVINKYGGDLTEIAKAYAHLQVAKTRSDQRAGSELQRLTSMVEDLGHQVALLNTPTPQSTRATDVLSGLMDQGQQYSRGQDPGPHGYAQPPQQPHVQQNPAAPDFWTQPESVIEGVLDRVVKKNLMAVETARERMRESESFNQRLKDQQAEIDRLQPIMAQIYSRRRSFYDTLPPNETLDILLEQARDREASMVAGRFFNELQANGVIPQGQPSAQQVTSPVLPNGAGLPTGVGGAGVGRAPGGPPQAGSGAGWSNTSGMRQLWQSRDGGADEMRAITEVLKERGQGDYIPIY